MIDDTLSSETHSSQPSSAEIQRWLVAHIAEELNLDPGKIQIDRPLYSFGVDSMQVVTLIAELEDWLGIRFESNPLEDHPTIASLAEFVADPVNGPPRSAPSPPAS